MVAEGLPTARLGDAAVFMNGDRGKNYPSGDAFVPHGIPFVNAGHLVGGRIDWRGMDYITPERFELLRGARFLPGDVLFCLRGTLGKLARVEVGAPTGTIASSLAVVRARNNCDARFLYYVLSSPLGQGLAKELDNGSAQPNISVAALAEVEVPLPPLPSQRAIAAVLGALDDKIDINRRLNETLEETARALFKSWFVDFDPVRAKAQGRQPFGMDAATAALFPDRFEVSELGEAPSGWPIVRVGDLVTLQRGTTYSGTLVGLPGPALLGLGSIVEGGGFREGHYKTYGGECPPKLMLFPGDLYVALKGATKDGSMVGSVARVPPTVRSGRLTQDTVKLEFSSPRPGLLAYVYRLLLTPAYRAYCAGRITGSAQVGLSRDDFLAYPGALPPDALLARFGEVETSLAQRTYAANAESKALAELRDYLLPKLLSGEVRVHDAEKLVGEAT